MRSELKLRAECLFKKDSSGFLAIYASYLHISPDGMLPKQKSELETLLYDIDNILKFFRSDVSKAWKIQDGL
jgi:hypothetical protein